MAIDYNIIGERLRKARLAKDLTQEQLAEELNISVAYLSRVETGTTRINLKRLSQLCRLLDISESELLSGVSDESENYLDSELSDILKCCSPEKQRLIYKIANIIADEEEEYRIK